MEAFDFRRHSTPILAALLTLVIIGWVPAVYMVDPIQFAALTPAAHVGVEAASAVSRLFAALILLLLPKSKYGRTIRWIAIGFAVLGIGSVIFGSFPYAFDYSMNRYEAVVGSLFISTIASALFLAGVLSERPPRVTWTILLTVIVLIAALKIFTFTQLELFPPLWETPPTGISFQATDDPLRGLTLWYWLLMPVPLILAVTAAVAALVHYRQQKLPGWLAISLVLWAGSQFHNIISPSTYDLVVATTDVLRFTFAMVIVVAGIFALHHSAQEYASFLESEQQLHRQLSQTAALKDDFTSMIAHELGSPVSAIRRFSEIAETGELNNLQSWSLQSIRQEADALQKLVADIQAIATIESDNFSVDFQPVPVEQFIQEAESFAVTLDGDHPFKVNNHHAGQVMADRHRIGQVLRNLIENAARYSNPGAPIELRVHSNGRSVSFEVMDRGYGIEPEEIPRIFEKFERGGHASSALVHKNGAGLGLYLSQQIVKAHGSEIRVVSQVGNGSTFRFILESTS